MRKFTYFFLSIILVGATFIMSCSKSTKGPTIQLIAKTGYFNSDQTVQITTPLLFGIVASAGDGKLNHFVVKRTFHDTTTTAKDTSFGAMSFKYDLHAFAVGSPGNEKWVFTVFDNNGGSSAVSITITTAIPTSVNKKTSHPEAFLCLLRR